MGTHHDPILAKIMAFLARSGMSQTGFGRKALGDPMFVHRLLEGRETRRSTREKVLHFIKTGEALK